MRVLGTGHRYFGKDSLGRGNSKALIDAVVACGFIPNDGPKDVAEVLYEQDVTKRGEGPSVLVEIETLS